eukprot:COSAG04_NODE_19078_length_425_cov_1.128834_1_plen_80_part_10
MYSDRDCSAAIAPSGITVSSTDYSDACESVGSAGSVVCPLFTDGETDTSGGCCSSDGAQWAGGDSGDDRAPSGTWVAYSF